MWKVLFVTCAVAASLFAQRAAKGVLVQQPTPVYPAAAKAIGQEGTVVLAATIGKDGRVSTLKVVSGPPLLRQAAMDAVRQWRFPPKVVDGEPVEVTTQIEVPFSLASVTPSK